MKRLFLVAFCAGAATVASASPLVTPGFEAGYLSQDFPEVTRLAFVGDVNHDGLLDVVTASTAGDVRTMFGAANGSFVTGPVHATSFRGAPGGCLRDFDGDGELDLALRIGNSIELYPGDGAGNFTTNRTIVTDLFQDIAFGEFTGDGLVDVVVSRGGKPDRSHDLVIYAGTASGPFQQIQLFPGIVPPPSELYGLTLYARDLDGDGIDDVVWAGPNQLRVYRGHSGGISPFVFVPLPDAPDFIQAGDFDGDGRLDLTTQARYSPGHWICRGLAGGTYDAATFEPTSVYRGQFRCADTDGDGKDELLYADTNAIVEPVDGVAGARKIALRSAASWWDVADVDGDGRADFISLANGGPGFTVCLSPPTGAGNTDVATGASPTLVVLADLDRDGNLDAVTPDFGSDQVTILWGDGAGGFPARTDLSVGHGPDALAVAQLDTDAWPDIVVSEVTAGKVGVLRGLGGRAFAAEASQVSGPHPRGIAIGDLTGDGLPDVAVAFDAENLVRVYPGDAAGNLGTAIPVATGASPASPAIADVDGDGRFDLVYALRLPGGIGVRLAQSGGTLGPELNAPAAGKTTRYSLVDIDHDGLVDFASIGDFNGEVVLAHNGGGGALQSYGSFTAANVSDVSSADYDGDGVPEVAFLQADGGGGAIGLNAITGPGVLPASKNFFGAGLNAASIATGDLNHDGRPDLVAASKSNSTVSVVLNRNAGPIVGVVPPDSAPSRLRFASRMPARGPFLLAYDSPSMDEGSIRVLSARGAVVYQAKILPNAAGAQMVRVAPTGLRGGVYWAEVRQGSFRDVVKFVFVP